MTLPKLEARAGELSLHGKLNHTYRRLRDYLTSTTTWGATHAGVLKARPVAYFSAEFGIHESIPIYSGGLGVLAGDHIVLPTGGTTQYPYTATGAFSSPADEPFLETLTLLGYLAASTRTIKLGSTVIIVPYRNPVVQAKMFASLDVLSHGRLICGVGVAGWRRSLRRSACRMRRVAP